MFLRGVALKNWPVSVTDLFQWPFVFTLLLHNKQFSWVTIYFVHCLPSLKHIFNKKVKYEVHKNNFLAFKLNMWKLASFSYYYFCKLWSCPHFSHLLFSLFIFWRTIVYHMLRKYLAWFSSALPSFVTADAKKYHSSYIFFIDLKNYIIIFRSLGLFYLALLLFFLSYLKSFVNSF